MSLSLSDSLNRLTVPTNKTLMSLTASLTEDWEKILEYCFIYSGRAGVLGVGQFGTAVRAFPVSNSILSVKTSESHPA